MIILAPFLVYLTINLHVLVLPKHGFPPTNLTQASMIFLGYTLELSGRSSQRGGGVGLYISNSLSYTILSDVSTFIEGCFESIFIDCSSHKNVVFGVIYRPPNSNIDQFHTMLEETLHKLSTKRCYILVTLT